MVFRLRKQPRTQEAWRHSSAGRARQRRLRRHRRRFIVVVVAALVVLAFAFRGAIGTSNRYGLPSPSTLADLSLRHRIVAIADSQVGYSTQPVDSYCNKFSAYWDAGTTNCPGGETSEEWCADFAAWYGGSLACTSSTATAKTRSTAPLPSFYEWGVHNAFGTHCRAAMSRHPVTSHLRSVSRCESLSVHAAIVTSDTPVAKWPDVVNGDGDRTGSPS